MKIFLLSLLLGAVLVTVIMHFFPKINYRSMPEGLCEGQLSSKKTNWVSSQVKRTDTHYVEPLRLSDIETLANCLKLKFPSMTVTEVNDSFLIAYRQSRVFNFVDWICIKKDGAVSASATLGHSDFGKNRELVEQIRLLCQGICGQQCD
ncbi:DUF1499 domain-containing protein [Legionella israelensis]|uniref:DUF1499 domain-containing protein n=1 Tax=Legionella israelensis TaxID=454 RepID=A0A0W0WQD1_9GAMM|nr:DUF1499 domain-containing protein [Legionella israelensis]KTD34526.1 hypothetical protein Lisr_0070 [Legionella israelensis]QBR83380.1 DUF1499 domain-containing protein [Legionella israelensis]QBS09241.1 DUF1499 domain-containing protein [Legionella israelensis]SCX98415.1 Uncharacterized conserved protein, DUF1499 family [Legionella israelensis DSM 19235]STX58987.1 Uncharacterized protein conserved in bacteria [Legionella israelensis]